MTSLYLLIPLSLVFLALVIAALFWAVSSGQYDDLEREGQSILFDDDLEQIPGAASPAASEQEAKTTDGMEKPAANWPRVPEQRSRDR